MLSAVRHERPSNPAMEPTGMSRGDRCERRQAGGSSPICWASIAAPMGYDLRPQLLGLLRDRLHPEDWREWGLHEDILQHLKQLWHVLVHYGEPVVRSGTA